MTGPDDLALMLRLAELVLAASVVEGLWLLTRRQAAPRGWLPNLLAGLSLALALRLGLGGAGVAWVAACLAAAGLCHLLDLRARWRRPVTVAAGRHRGVAHRAGPHQGRVR